MPSKSFREWQGSTPALESAHAIAWALKRGEERPGETILLNLSGRGYKDIDYVAENFGYGQSDHDIHDRVTPIRRPPSSN